MVNRRDYKTALLIEPAIHKVQEQNRARVLVALGAPFETAMRVLTRPVRQRHA